MCLTLPGQSGAPSPLPSELPSYKDAIGGPSIPKTTAWRPSANNWLLWERWQRRQRNMTIMILSTAQKIKLSDLLGFKGRGKREEKRGGCGRRWKRGRMFEGLWARGDFNKEPDIWSGWVLVMYNWCHLFVVKMIKCCWLGNFTFY